MYYFLKEIGMNLYTERHGLRSPVKRTYDINSDMYLLLLNSCEKYEKNLTHIFVLNCHDDFTDSDYIGFNKIRFEAKMRLKIPNIFRNEAGKICVPSSYDVYDKYALLDYIEYFAQNIQDICEYWNSDRHKNYKIIECLGTDNIFFEFKGVINEIFTESGLLYELTDKKIIERIVENSPLTNEVETSVESVREVGTKELLKDAIALYKTPNDAARQDSVEKIWDALERLKTYYIELNKKESVKKIVTNMSNGNNSFFELFNKEFLELTSIGNTYRIRHHETDKIDIIDSRYYDYLFNRCLSLIALAIQYLEN